MSSRRTKSPPPDQNELFARIADILEGPVNVAREVASEALELVEGTQVVVRFNGRD